MKPGISTFRSVELYDFRYLLFIIKTESSGCRVDRKQFKCSTGAWAFWIPKLRMKFLHSRNGFVHCMHAKAPGRDFLFSEKLRGGDRDATGNYTWREWKQAYSKSAIRRTAENYIASKRLYDAGLGPKPLGICMAADFIHNGHHDTAGLIGLSTEDATLLSPKLPASESEILAAGVYPDKIKSCLRQQINGYVVDLNSVVGVVPIDADEEVHGVELHILEKYEDLMRNTCRLSA